MTKVEMFMVGITILQFMMDYQTIKHHYQDGHKNKNPR